MTAYEIADLRAAMGERIMGLVRVWFTVTFAVFAVAYSVGTSLDNLSIAMLILFDAAVVFIVSAMLRFVYTQITSLALDAAQLETQPIPHILSQNLVAVPFLASKVLLTAVPISFLVYCLYIYQIVF